MTFTGRRQTKNDDQKTPKIIELRELNNETLGKLYALRVLNNQSRSSCSFFFGKATRVKINLFLAKWFEWVNNEVAIHVRSITQVHNRQRKLP